MNLSSGRRRSQGWRNEGVRKSNDFIERNLRHFSAMDVIMVIASNGVSFALDRLEALGGELIEWKETIARMEK